MITVILLTVGIGVGLLFAARGGGDSPSSPRTAAIVDQLSLTKPNPSFSERALGLLQEAGYAADYYPGKQVTVDFYRNLPALDYDLIILRVHSGITFEVDATSGQRTETEYVSLYTGEPYDEDRYPGEPIGRLGKASPYEGAPPLFAIGPEFIRESMEGRFDDTIIIMMGCDGLRSERVGQIFLDRGAHAFVSWS